MNELKKLQRRFDYISKTFFPRWDNSDWKVEIKPNNDFDGRCEMWRKVIVINRWKEDQNEMDCLLIHEICHYVSCDGHWEKFCRKMRRIADRAEKMGRNRLGLLIRISGDRWQYRKEELEEFKKEYEKREGRPFKPSVFFGWKRRKKNARKEMNFLTLNRPMAKERRRYGSIK